MQSHTITFQNQVTPLFHHHPSSSLIIPNHPYTNHPASSLVVLNNPSSFLIVLNHLIFVTLVNVLSALQ
jgi:hypothetical protein